MWPTVPADRDALLADVLSAEQAAAFRRLSRHDQGHLLRVYQALRAESGTSDDLLVAALLHDLGKVSTDPPGRVRFVDRIAKVVLRRAAPPLLERLAGWPAPRWRRGLALAVHHAALGARQAAALGCSVRVCWLIAHHEDGTGDDPELARLTAVDHATP